MTIATGQFELKRSFTAPQHRMWHLLTDPSARSLWGAPSDDDTLEMVQANLHEGGCDLHRCGPAENPAYLVETHWYRLAPPELACFSETVLADDMRIATSLVTYGLSQKNGDTILDLVVHVSSFVGPEALPDFEAGWQSALGRLSRQLESGILSQFL